MQRTSSALPDLGVPRILCRCHDAGIGLFKGMVIATVERVNPHVARLEANYQAHGRMVNSVLAGTAVGGFCYAPWWSLAVAALVVPSIYAGYRLNAPQVTTSGTETGDPLNNTPVVPGLSITGIRLPTYAVAEETEILLARLVPVFISVLQVALELRDVAHDKALGSIKVITALERRAVGEEAAEKQCKQRRSAMRKLLTEKHFMTLVANNQASSQMLVNCRVADYNHLAELFLVVAQHVNLDRSLSQSAELSAWLLNEMLKTWITLTPDQLKGRLNALLVEDRTDVIRQFNVNILRENTLSAHSVSP